MQVTGIFSLSHYVLKRLLSQAQSLHSVVNVFTCTFFLNISQFFPVQDTSFPNTILHHKILTGQILSICRQQVQCGYDHQFVFDRLETLWKGEKMLG